MFQRLNVSEAGARTVVRPVSSGNSPETRCVTVTRPTVRRLPSSVARKGRSPRIAEFGHRIETLLRNTDLSVSTGLSGDTEPKFTGHPVYE